MSTTQDNNPFGHLPPDGTRFTHEGIECYATMSAFSINGYLQLPEGHPWLDYDGSLENRPDIDVHGGITYHAGRVIGFDTNHIGDAWHPQSDAMKRNPFYAGISLQGRVWKEPEVIEETKRLAEQVVEAAA